MTSIANIVNDNNKEEEKKCEICYYPLEKKEIQRNILPCRHLCCSYCMNESKGSIESILYRKNKMLSL